MYEIVQFYHVIRQLRKYVMIERLQHPAELWITCRKRKDSISVTSGILQELRQLLLVLILFWQKNDRGRQSWPPINKLPFQIKRFAVFHLHNARSVWVLTIGLIISNSNIGWLGTWSLTRPIAWWKTSKTIGWHTSRTQCFRRNRVEPR